MQQLTNEEILWGQFFRFVHDLAERLRKEREAEQEANQQQESPDEQNKQR